MFCRLRYAALTVGMLCCVVFTLMLTHLNSAVLVDVKVPLTPTRILADSVGNANYLQLRKQ